ncbi:MAG: putative transrane anti-sigma factor [Nevskia sp.]|nr:putative transrane anti-sigma factor [Nevskia sp.]
MNCTEVRALLAVYGDGELDLPRAVALEQHLAGCADCTALLREQNALRSAIRTHAPYHRAPEALRARLHAALPAATDSDAPVAQRARRPRSTATLRRWSGALAAALALAIGINLLYVAQRGDDALADEVVAGHVRSLQAAHLADVPSTDQHTVKPWFAGKLDFSPPVHDLADAGFVLTGGRLDYIDHRNVAALIYRHRQHVINLFVWPAGSDTDRGSSVKAREGYNLLHWTAEGDVWWAVSDLNAEELREFEQRLRQAGATPS